MIPKVHFDLMFDQEELVLAKKILAEYKEPGPAMQNTVLNTYIPLLLAGDTRNVARATGLINAVGILATAKIIPEHDYGMETMSRDPRFGVLTSLMSSAMGLKGDAWDSFVNLTGHVFYNCGSWFATGKHVYDVMPGLGDRLMHTDFRGLKGEDVRLPFPSVYLVCPPNLGIIVRNGQSGDHNLVGLYMTLSNTPREGERRLSFLAVGEWSMVMRNGVEMPDDALTYWTVKLFDKMDLQECLDMSKSGMRLTPGWLPQQWDELTYFGVKAMCYATSVNARADLVPYDPRADKIKAKLSNKNLKPRQRDRLRDELKGLDQRRRIVLGAGYAPLPRGTRRPGTPLAVRTKVAGHFRRVPCGPGRQDRKRRWIEPFWRGPIDGEVSNPTRVLAT